MTNAESVWKLSAGISDYASLFFYFFNSTVHGSGYLRGNMVKTKKGDAAG